MKIGPRIKQIGIMKTHVTKKTLNLTYFCRIFHNIKKINIQSPEQLALANLNNSMKQSRAVLTNENQHMV